MGCSTRSPRPCAFDRRSGDPQFWALGVPAVIMMRLAKGGFVGMLVNLLIAGLGVKLIWDGAAMLAG